MSMVSRTRSPSHTHTGPEPVPRAQVFISLGIPTELKPAKKRGMADWAVVCGVGGWLDGDLSCIWVWVGLSDWWVGGCCRALEGYPHGGIGVVGEGVYVCVVLVLTL